MAIFFSQGYAFNIFPQKPVICLSVAYPALSDVTAVYETSIEVCATYPVNNTNIAAVWPQNAGPC